MYGVHLTIRPTSHLTFRVLPGSILDINTYPFIPPSTLSGWLYRLWHFAKTSENPEFLETGLKNSPYYYLPRELICLGAYSKGTVSLHRTKRHGTKGFSSVSRSALVTDEMEAPQLHTWSYLFVDEFVGFVVSESKELLQALTEPLREDGETLPLGCELGKEGFGFLENISETSNLTLSEERCELDIWPLLPLEDAVQGQIDFELYTLYKPVWEESFNSNWMSASNVIGFEQLPLALPQRGNLHTRWLTGDGIRIPQSLVEVFR